MKRLTLALVVIVATALVTGAALAGGMPMTDAGSKQIVFGFTGLDNLGLNPYSYDSHPQLAFRYFLNDGMAVRPGVYIGYDKTTDEQTDVETTGMDLALSAVIEKYLPSVHSVAPYIGIGAGFGYNKDETTNSSEVTTTGTSIDVLGVAGFQWYFTDALSLGGEYVGAFRHSSSKTEVDGDTTSETSMMKFYWYAASVYLSVNLP
jgi:hypothetical protein